MPIFEFKCAKCSHEFERIVFSGEEDNVDCPECGEKKVKKLMSSTSFIGNKGVASTCAAPKGFS